MSNDERRHRQNDEPQKWGSIFAVVAVLGLAGYMTLESMEPQASAHKEASDAGVVAPVVGSATPASTAVILLDAGAATIDLDASLALSPFTFDASLPSSAPRSVKVGIVFVTYAGAEGAPTNSRPRAQAKEVADGLLPMARSDFHQAVGKGDSGSADDIGRIPRGVLDPAVEAAVFGLQQNDVSEVVETSKGFWIVKRLD